MSISDDPTASSSPTAAPKSAESIQRAHSAIQSLSQILGPLPAQLSSSEDPAFALLKDPAIASVVSGHLLQPNSGAGDDNLCRWFYDTFQSTDPSLQLAVLRFLPTIGGLYLSRCTACRNDQPLAGFEAVLLALYAHETMAREGKPLTVDLPNLSAPSPYHEAKCASIKSNKNTEEPIIATAVISSALEPHGTVRSTKRAKIVGVALELYYDKIFDMPAESKVEFCEFALAWAGHCSSSENESKGKRIPLPWELLMPTLRIVGHCLLGRGEVNAAAMAAAKGIYERAIRDMEPRALLAARSLMRMGMLGVDVVAEPPLTSIYSEISESESAELEVSA